MARTAHIKHLYVIFARESRKITRQNAGIVRGRKKTNDASEGEGERRRGEQILAEERVRDKIARNELSGLDVCLMRIVENNSGSR